MSPWLHYTVTECTGHAKVMRSTNRMLLRLVISKVNSFRVQSFSDPGHGEPATKDAPVAVHNFVIRR